MVLRMAAAIAGLTRSMQAVLRPADTKGPFGKVGLDDICSASHLVQHLTSFHDLVVEQPDSPLQGEVSLFSPGGEHAASRDKL